MKRLSSLLPNRSTDWDRALVDVVDSRSRIADRIARIVGARHDAEIDPALLPWLLRDWGLGDAAAFVEDWQLLYREGKAWTRERGTDAAQLRAFRWLGLEGARVDPILPGGNRWALYQIGLTEAPESLAGIPALVGISRLSKPARSILERIYGGFDVRAIRLDNALADGGLLDFDSGAVVDPAWPVLSFGRKLVSELDSTADHYARDVLAIRRELGSAVYVDALMLDWSMPDFQLKSQYRDFSITVDSSFETDAEIANPSNFNAYRIIKAGIRLDAGWDLRDPNNVFTGTRTIPRGRPWLADGFLPETDTDWHEEQLILEILSAREVGEATFDGGSFSTVLRAHNTGLVAAFAGGFVLDGSAPDVSPMDEVRVEATQTVSLAGGVATYPSQSWIDLRAPENATWESLAEIIGTSI